MKSTDPLTQKELDGMQCANPACKHQHDPEMVVHSRCHPDIPTWSWYNRETGRLTIKCAECDKPVATVAVAS